MTHPLTFQTIAAISKQRLITMDLTEDMRSAADWQLEQVIEFIAKEDTVYADYIKQAMRPQETP